MPGKAFAMTIRQTNWLMPAQFIAGGRSEGWRKQWMACVIEADKAAVKRSIPECREQQAIVNIEALCIAWAILPRNDMRSAK